MQDAHYADDGADDAAFAAADDALGGWWFGEHAAVAGALAGRVVKDEELAGRLEGGGGDEWFGEEDADVGDEVAGGWVIGAVEDKVVLGDDGFGVLGSEVGGVGFIGDGWVKSIR